MTDIDFIREFNSLVIAFTNSVDKVDPITQITENIFVGQGRTTLYGGMLNKLGITHVLSVSRPPHGSVKNGPFKIMEISDAPDQPNTDLKIHFPKMFNFIRESIEKNGKIYVHCEMGCSRAATVVIAYLKHSNPAISLQSIHDHIKIKRPWICPNLGFQEQLRSYFSEPLVIV